MKTGSNYKRRPPAGAIGAGHYVSSPWGHLSSRESELLVIMWLPLLCPCHFPFAGLPHQQGRDSSSSPAYTSFPTTWGCCSQVLAFLSAARGCTCSPTGSQEMVVRQRCSEMAQKNDREGHSKDQGSGRAADKEKQSNCDGFFSDRRPPRLPLREKFSGLVLCTPPAWVQWLVF